MYKKRMLSIIMMWHVYVWTKSLATARSHHDHETEWIEDVDVDFFRCIMF